MAQLREKRQNISGTPMTSGLDLSAGRDEVAEDQLWELEGLFVDENNSLSKRPAFVNWGTQIVEPTKHSGSDDKEISEIIHLNSDTTGEPVIVGDSVSAIYDHGALVLSGWKVPVGGTDGSASVTREIGETESFNDTYEGTYTLSFVVQVKDIELGEYARIYVATQTDKQKEFVIHSGGLGWAISDTLYYTFADTSGIVDGRPHRVDITVIAGLAAGIYVDGISRGSNYSTYVQDTDDFFVRISGVSDDQLEDTPYSITISSLILVDGQRIELLTKPVADMQTVKEIKSASFTDHNSLLVATSSYLWVDYGINEIFRPVGPLLRDRSRFSKFRGSTILCNYSEGVRKSEVYEFDGNVLTELTNAPDLRFTTEFTNRVWGAGDVNNPLRLYYSGDRQSNTWYNPSDPNIPATEDTELEAGFIEFPGDDKDRIRLVDGDFFGMLLVATSNELYIVTGTSPDDYSRKRLTGALSAAGDRCGIDVYNDYWVMGKDGVSSVQTTDKFGDVEGKKLSSSTRLLFNTDIASGRALKPETLHSSLMSYYSKINTMVMYSEEMGKDVPGVMYSMNAESGKWSGPWRESCTALRNVVLKSPVQDMIAIGTSDGRVKYMTTHAASDDTIKMSSAVITGRSINPRFDTMKKNWGTFRLKIAPTGNWDITFRWKVEDRDWKTKTMKLAKPTHDLVGSTAITGTSVSKSNTQPMILEFPLECKGHSIKWEIETTAPRFRGLRWELDFDVTGHERT